jgi:cation:H+ antiporter
MDMLLTIATTLVLLFAIVWVCTVFTNAVEWLGHRFNLSEGAVGSVLAAVGTALPETLVPIVAILGGVWAQQHGKTNGLETGHDIGVGAILGAPFMLATLAMCLSGTAVLIYKALGKRGLDLNVNLGLFRRDLLFFFPPYVAAILVGQFQALTPIKYGVPLALLLWYAFYVYQTFQSTGDHTQSDDEFEFEPLMLAPKSLEPKTGLIFLQTALGLAGIAVTAHLFVGQIEHLSVMLNINALILSLLIIPIATELPEKFNSVVWLGKKKDHLALGNLTGAMVFQGCIPPAIGIAFTPWVLTPQSTFSILLCTGAAGFLLASTYVYNRLAVWPMVLCGLFYASFLVYTLGGGVGVNAH